MKRSKVFLGITASLLAVVAFASTKAKFTNKAVGYSISGTCDFYRPNLPASTVQSQSPLKYNAHQLFTYTTTATGGICGLPVYAE